MVLTQKDLKMQYELNEGVKSLLAILGNKSVAVDPNKTWVDYKQATTVLERSRKWLSLNTFDEVPLYKSLNRCLIKDVDWVWYGNQKRFLLSSLNRLKEACIKEQ